MQKARQQRKRRGKQCPPAETFFFQELADKPIPEHENATDAMPFGQDNAILKFASITKLSVSFPLVEDTISLHIYMTLAGLEPAIFGSEDQRLIH